MKEKEFLELMQQKEKEIFHPIISEDGYMNIKMLEKLTASLLESIQKEQKKKGSIEGQDMLQFVKGIIVGWENRHEIMKLKK